MPNSEFEGDSYPGLCEICGDGQVFARTHRAIRETYQCQTCRGLLRERAQASVIVACYARAGFGTLADLAKEASFRALCVYEPGATGAFRRYLRGLPMYHQSDYVQESERGQESAPLPHQDLESLTYPSSFLDLVISSDILEHVRRPAVAFQEIARVLKPGGRHIFTVPLQHPLPAVTVARVDTSCDD
ncbi:MAG: class I SAM-dependent methyltransferase, partial [Gammaproteobacteria bacterium]